jgi:NADH-quinone oxidoreductase subunit L
VAHALETLPFQAVPLAASILVALGGLAAGYVVYGMNPLRAKQPDPLQKPLGPIYGFLRNKWYWDELYHEIFIRPAVFFSEVVVYAWVDRGLIDGTLHLIARAFYKFGEYTKKFEEVVISQGVDWIKDQVLASAKEARAIQTGKIQEYVLVSLLITGALALVVLMINAGLFDTLLN